MNYTKQWLLLEAKRYFNEFERSPTAIAWGENVDYPSLWFVQERFGSWTRFLIVAGLELNKRSKEKSILCEICGEGFKTNRKDRQICRDPECKYVRDSLLSVERSKKKTECSLLNYISREDLIIHFQCKYRKKNRE